MLIFFHLTFFGLISFGLLFRFIGFIFCRLVSEKKIVFVCVACIERDGDLCLSVFDFHFFLVFITKFPNK